MIDYTNLQNKSIALLISGGVDSAVSLHLLCENGCKPDCYYIKIGPEQEEGYNCNSDEDIEMCQWLTNKYNCKFDIIDCHNDYWTKVTGYTMDCVKKGYTPNPDVMCNKLIKFGVFIDKIGYKYDYIATGHYAQTKIHTNLWTNETDVRMYCAPDPVKDQTDFLCQLDGDIINKTIFPIGHLMKEEVRKIAEENHLINSKRKDSQGICFLGKINYNDYIKKFLGEKEGDFIEYETGKVLGKHNGYWFHTIGQRKGIPLSHGPWYVVSKDIDKNIVYISNNQSAAETNKIFMENIHWISFDPFCLSDMFPNEIAPMIECHIKIRHSPDFYFAYLYKLDNGYAIKLPENLVSAAPGQYCVIYDAKSHWCLGSGVIQYPPKE